MNIHAQSFDSRNKQIKTLKIRNSSIKRNIPYNENPTPLNFDSFIPWFCLELQVPKNVIVTRKYQVEYVRYDSKSSKLDSVKLSKSKSKTTKSKQLSRSDVEDKKISIPICYSTSTAEIKDAVPITTYYDRRGQLVEISIVGCAFEIPRKVIQAINLCLPFHTGLFKLSIQKGGLGQGILYEISKLLPHSNITDLCLDDSLLPGGIYSILLDRPSQIKYLSLKRCSINDQECKKMALQLDLQGSALKTLLLLDLTSNNITDEGAQALGEILKYNRYLRHLNLSGNRVSDAGASFIFRYLQEFALSYDDVKEKRRRRMDYVKSKSITYQKCLEDIKLARFESETKKNVSSDKIDQAINITQHRKRNKTQKQVVSSLIVEKITVEDEAERKTVEILGQFEDPFGEQYIKRKGDSIYCIGNLTLSSLNLAYNNLSLYSVRKILDVLKYQSEIKKIPPNTGVKRLVLEGNNIHPTLCDELNEIDTYLKRALFESEQSINLIH